MSIPLNLKEVCHDRTAFPIIENPRSSFGYHTGNLRIELGVDRFFDVNLVEAIFGQVSIISRIVYCLVGVSALYEIVMYRTIQRRWECKPWPKMAE